MFEQLLYFYRQYEDDSDVYEYVSVAALIESKYYNGIGEYRPGAFAPRSLTP
jgi:hypothetical protein